MTSAPNISIVVPAHNESAGIAGTLKQLLAATAPDSGERPNQPDSEIPNFELIVACNACTDSTAEVAHTAAPGACIVERPERGKAGALNQAFAYASGNTMLVVDADTTLDRQTLAALVTTLGEEGVLAASPAVRFDFEGVSPIVRAYCRAFTRHPYLQSGVGGAGVYGLSSSGRAALGEFPQVIADDEYVRRKLPMSGQRRVSAAADGTPVFVWVKPPRTLRALIRTDIRSRRGDRELRQLHTDAAGAAHSKRWLAKAILAAPLDVLLFLSLKLTVLAILPFVRQGQTPGWSPLRD